VTASHTYSTFRAAAWAAWRQEPDADGIRRVAMATAGQWPGPYFCLTEGGLWFVEDPTDAPGVPLEPPKACPLDWVPPELRQERVSHRRRGVGRSF
jgi:hypothetical protein